MTGKINDMKAEFNQKIQETTATLDDNTQRLGEVEKKMAETERWDIAVKDTLTLLLEDNQTLRNKVSDLQGHAEKNQLRISGLVEDSEGTNMPLFIASVHCRLYQARTGRRTWSV